MSDLVTIDKYALNCKICGDKTKVMFNIDFKATPICEPCATSIFLQQAKWYAEKNSNHNQQ